MPTNNAGWTDDDAERRRAIDAEIERDERWAVFENCCIEFAEDDREGWTAVFRAAARAMASQGQLYK